MMKEFFSAACESISKKPRRQPPPERDAIIQFIEISRQEIMQMMWMCSRRANVYFTGVRHYDMRIYRRAHTHTRRVMAK